MQRELNDFRAEIVRKKIVPISFKGLHLTFYEFYLVMPPLRIRCALILNL